MTVSMYRELLARAEAEALGKDARGEAQAFAPLSDLIDTMTWDERLELREALASAGETRVMQNLAYDYQRQAWIVRGVA